MGIFGIINSGLPFSEVFIMLLAWVLAIGVALVIHEYMHAFTAYKCGDSTAKMMGRMTFNPMAHFEWSGFLCLLLIGFGWAKGVPVNENNFRNVKKGRILVSLSGAGTNVLLGIIFTMFAVLTMHFWGDSSILFLRFLTYLCIYLAMINLVLGIFNLLPIYPLDGFNFIAAFLRYDNKFCLFMRKYGTMIMFGILLISAFIPQYGLGRLFGMIYDSLFYGFNNLFF